MEDLIGTSINIEKSRLARLLDAAQILKISENELLSILLEKSRKTFGKKGVIKQTVKYQRDYNPTDYVIHHVVFNGVDYEFATGRRYLFKISVSFLIRLAIDKYLEEIITEWLTEPAAATAARERYITNFHYEHFDVYYRREHLAEYWLIPWPKE